MAIFSTFWPTCRRYSRITCVVFMHALLSTLCLHYICIINDLLSSYCTLLVSNESLQWIHHDRILNSVAMETGGHHESVGNMDCFSRVAMAGLFKLTWTWLMRAFSDTLIDRSYRVQNENIQMQIHYKFLIHCPSVFNKSENIMLSTGQPVTNFRFSTTFWSSSHY